MALWEEMLKKWEQRMHRTERTWASPFYVVAHINNYCQTVHIRTIESKPTKETECCPCMLSWLCDGVWVGKPKMSSPYDAAILALREENFGKEASF